MLLLDAPRDTQPQEYAEIDWGNPICAGLHFVQVGDSPVNVVGSPVIIGGSVGRSTANGILGLDFASGYLLGNTRSVVSGALATALALHLWTSASGNRVLIGTFVPGGHSMYMGIEGNNWSTIAQDGAFKINTGAAVTPANNRVYVAVGRFMGPAGQDMWIDGVPLQSLSTSLNVNTGTVNVASYDFGSGVGFSGAMFLSAWWDRVLSDDEVRAVSANPWQLFRGDSLAFVARTALQRLVPVSTVANSGWTPSSGTAHAALAALTGTRITTTTSGASVRVALG